MLIYNPAFDFHHSAFRFLQILVAGSQQQFEIERLRILDFFLLFPEEISSIQFPREIARKRTLFRRKNNPYSSIGNARRIYAEIAPIQQVALRSLVARGLIEADAFQRGYVVRTDEPLPPELSNAVISRNQASPQLLDLVSSDLASLPLHGKGGLKERANLQDTRYDAV